MSFSFSFKKENRELCIIILSNVICVISLVFPCFFFYSTVVQNLQPNLMVCS